MFSVEAPRPRPGLLPSEFEAYLPHTIRGPARINRWRHLNHNSCRTAVTMLRRKLKAAISGGEVSLRRKNEIPSTTQRLAEDHDSRHALTPMTRSNADMTPEHDDSDTVTRLPDTTKPAAGRQR